MVLPETDRFWILTLFCLMIGGVVTIRFLTVTRPAPQTMWLSPWQISGLRNWVHLVRMFVPRVMRRPAMMTSLVTRFMSDCSNGSLCCTPWSFTDLSYIRTDWLTADLLAPSAAGKVSTCEETWQRERVREYVCGVVWCGVVWCGVVPIIWMMISPTIHWDTDWALPRNPQSPTQTLIYVISALTWAPTC